MKNSIRCSMFALLLFTAVFGYSAPQLLAQEPTPPKASISGQGVFEIGVGEARLLPITGVPKTIIVGDETTIAANIIQNDILVFTGIAHGKTNVIVLDAAGRTIEQVWVSVVKSGAPLTVRRGTSTEEYRCNPSCRPEDELPIAPTARDKAAVPG